MAVCDPEFHVICICQIVKVFEKDRLIGLIFCSKVRGRGLIHVYVYLGSCAGVLLNVFVYVLLLAHTYIHIFAYILACNFTYVHVFKLSVDGKV